MTVEDLEKLKKDHDYCIIPVENILDIEDIDPMRFKIDISASADSGEFCQFVNSEYFKTWGTKFEEMNDSEVEDD